MKRILSIALVAASLATSVTLPKDSGKPAVENKSFFSNTYVKCILGGSAAVGTVALIIKAVTLYRNSK